MRLVTSHSRCSAISREPQISRPNAISASGGTVNSCSVKGFCAFCVVTCLGRIHSRLAEQLRFPVYSDDPTGEGGAIRTPSPHPHSHFQCDAAREFQLSLDKNDVTKYLSPRNNGCSE